jgi:hypothetical protein
MRIDSALVASHIQRARDTQRAAARAVGGAGQGTGLSPSKAFHPSRQVWTGVSAFDLLGPSKPAALVITLIGGM